ncbi:hypothetical protein IEQ34_009923 [Dendrobium chrysotoxum]|uniref:H15 domain-containing protein n=1 Tax=Dendrobium chrysotoxum TaxID=161865 RepID=A0AAV7H3T8_DENCH|nr:hypothetical protein IEQ34_009923 [Dendrobium chrysotoxum]
MVAVAASPTPGAAAGSPFATRSHDHPPYKDMVLNALEALNGRNGSSRHAISKYISDNYSDLPPTHSSLLSHHLRRLQSNGVIQMFKHSYKLADPPAAEDSGAAVGSKKRGRPRKNVPAPSSVLDKTPKKRGRPPKLGAGAPPAKKIKPDRLPTAKTPAVVDPAAVYILPQAEQLKSGFLQSLPGAVAIVLPVGLLSKKTAKSPVLILPNGVQSLVDASVGRKKLGRPKKIEVKKKPDQPKVVERRPPGLPRRKSMLPKQVLLHNGGTTVSHVNIGAKKLGRPRKIRDSVLPENGQLKSFVPDKLATTETEQGILEKTELSSKPESFQAVQNIPSLELKKRPLGRPKKNTIVEGPKSPRTTALAT